MPNLWRQLAQGIFGVWLVYQVAQGQAQVVGVSQGTLGSGQDVGKLVQDNRSGALRQVRVDLARARSRQVIGGYFALLSL